VKEDIQFMNKGENYNKPRVGSKIAVDPIRRMKDIQSISKLLSDHPRNHLLFVMGTNNGLRTGDLLKLKVGDTLVIKEGKTGNRNILVRFPSMFLAIVTGTSAPRSSPSIKHALADSMIR
jgi:hypothetical protein